MSSMVSPPQTRAGRSAATSQYPEQPRETTVQTVKADYFKNIRLCPEGGLTFDARFEAEVEFPSRRDGLTVVSVPNNNGNKFSLGSYNTAVLSGTTINVGSDKVLHHNGTGCSLLAWPSTGQLPGGLQGLQRFLENPAEGLHENPAEGTQALQQSLQNQTEGSRGTQQLPEDYKQDSGSEWNNWGVPVEQGDDVEEEDDGKSNGT